MGNYGKHFWGSREQRKKISGSREHELKTFLGTRGFINGEQGIKSKKIKGSWEHVPPLGGAHQLKINIIYIITDTKISKSIKRCFDCSYNYCFRRFKVALNK